MSSQSASLATPVFGGVNAVAGQGTSSDTRTVFATTGRGAGASVRRGVNTAVSGARAAKQSVSSAKHTTKTLGQRLKHFLHEAFGEFDSHAGKLSLNDLINAESAIGATIFGPIPEGHRREFFHHNNNIWIWHESWQDDGVEKETTIRYEVRPDGVYKRPLGSSYTKLTGAELENFRRAVHAYLALIKQRLY